MEHIKLIMNIYFDAFWVQGAAHRTSWSGGLGFKSRHEAWLAWLWYMYSYVYVIFISIYIRRNAACYTYGNVVLIKVHNQ
jgi:hypothetical protein